MAGYGLMGYQGKKKPLSLRAMFGLAPKKKEEKPVRRTSLTEPILPKISDKPVFYSPVTAKKTFSQAAPAPFQSTLPRSPKLAPLAQTPKVPLQEPKPIVLYRTKQGALSPITFTAKTIAPIKKTKKPKLLTEQDLLWIAKDSLMGIFFEHRKSIQAPKLHYREVQKIGECLEIVIQRTLPELMEKYKTRQEYYSETNPPISEIQAIILDHYKGALDETEQLVKAEDISQELSPDEIMQHIIIPKVDSILGQLKILSQKRPPTPPGNRARRPEDLQQLHHLQLNWVEQMIHLLMTLKGLCGRNETIQDIANFSQSFKTTPALDIRDITCGEIINSINQEFTNAQNQQRAFELLSLIKNCSFIRTQLSESEINQMEYQYTLLAQKHRIKAQEKTVVSSDPASPKSLSADPFHLASTHDLESDVFFDSPPSSADSSSYESPPPVPTTKKTMNALVFAPRHNKRLSSCGSETFRGFSETFSAPVF